MIISVSTVLIILGYLKKLDLLTVLKKVIYQKKFTKRLLLKMIFNFLNL